MTSWYFSKIEFFHASRILTIDLRIGGLEEVLWNGPWDHQICHPLIYFWGALKFILLNLLYSKIYANALSTNTAKSPQ